jgi:Predicted hydrolases or acyltransferases (alpha/beta hydrolase superfamily)
MLRQENLSSFWRAGATIHYWRSGNRYAPTVVLSHGATLDHSEWQHNIAPLEEHFNVVRWDLRGHGKSRESAFSIDEALEDLRELLDLLEQRSVFLLGHSMGGNLHQRFAQRYPQRVTAMICLGCTWNYQHLSFSERSLIKLSEPMLRLLSYEQLVRQAVAVCSNHSAGRALIEAAMRQLDKEAIIAIMLETLKFLDEQPDYRFNKPLLLMYGDQDRTGNIRKAMQRWHQHESQSELIVIPNASHAANIDNPSFFNREVLRFLSQYTVLNP